MPDNSRRLDEFEAFAREHGGIPAFRHEGEMFEPSILRFATHEKGLALYTYDSDAGLAETYLLSVENLRRALADAGLTLTYAASGFARARARAQASVASTVKSV
jgi:hypothetical protein